MRKRVYGDGNLPTDLIAMLDRMLIDVQRQTLAFCEECHIEPYDLEGSLA
jgi:hypothetical protein